MKLIVSLVMCISLLSCSTAYYSTMEKFGVHKRDILVDRVEESRDVQKDAQKQFSSALEQFKSVVAVDGGNIEKVYDRLNGEYEKSRAAAEEIHVHVRAIDGVSKALFKEWQNELKQYSNGALKRESEQKLRSTKEKYAQLYSAMQKTESRLQPVLDAMKDQVLYLKHNLNARAIQSLKQESIKIDRDVDVLLAAMKKSIAEADAFIREMRN